MSESAVAIPSAPALQACLQIALAPDMLEVIDESAEHAGHAGSNGLGHGTHFRVRIGGAVFAGKSRVAQHRLVYDALQKFTDAGMHALAIEVRRS
jgi:BolA protein